MIIDKKYLGKNGIKFYDERTTILIEKSEQSDKIFVTINEHSTIMLDYVDIPNYHDKDVNFRSSIKMFKDGVQVGFIIIDKKTFCKSGDSDYYEC